MELLLISLGGIIAILLGRILMKRWYNHLSVYSLLWTVSLTFYTLRLIRYYDISTEAWFYISVGWFMFFLGSSVVIATRASREELKNTSVSKKKPDILFSIDVKFLSRTIIVLSILSFVAVVYTFASVIRAFGSIGAAIIQANLLYRLRLEGELGAIPYLSSFPLAASCLAGIYTTVRRRLTLLGVLPFVLVVLHGIVVMGRTNIFIALAVFTTAFLFTPHKRFANRKTAVIASILVATITLGGLTFISSARKLVVHFKHETQEMAAVRDRLLFLPSFYFYVTAPPVAFSEYLLMGEEKYFPGTFTFKPAFNILNKVGLVDSVPSFNPFICTPEPINAGTYLREIHADFGPPGVMIFPYILGVILTMLHLGIHRRPTAVRIVLLAHAFAVVWLSWDINTVKLGQWAVSMLISLLIALKLDSQAKKGSINS